MDVPRELELTLEGPVYTVTFNRPAARNAMTLSMYEGLIGACEDVDADPAVRIMVLRGQGGKAFSAGTDVGELERFASADGGVEYEAFLERALARLEAVDVPVIAAVQGVATGAGLVMCSVADICVAEEGSRFGAPMARTLGNCLSVANCRRVTAAVGAGQARRLLFLAELICAAEAERIGLVHALTKPDDFEERLQGVVERVLECAPLTLHAYKMALTRLGAEVSGGADDRAAGDGDIIRCCYGSADFKEGLRAFRAREKPRWRGE